MSQNIKINQLTSTLKQSTALQRQATLSCQNKKNFLLANLLVAQSSKPLSTLKTTNTGNSAYNTVADHPQISEDQDQESVTQTPLQGSRNLNTANELRTRLAAQEGSDAGGSSLQGERGVGPGWQQNVAAAGMGERRLVHPNGCTVAILRE